MGQFHLIVRLMAGSMESKMFGKTETKTTPGVLSDLRQRGPNNAEGAGYVRRWLQRHFDERLLNAEKARLARTSPHLLHDAGLADDTTPPLRHPPQFNWSPEGKEPEAPQTVWAIAAE
jgi:hypothetical protein